MDAVFETELVGIRGVAQPPPVVSSAGDSASTAASSELHEATEGIKEKIVSNAGEATDATKISAQDTDGDGQEHNEL